LLQYVGLTVSYLTYIYDYQILGNNHLDVLFHVFIYFMSLHVSSVTAVIIRRSNCINTSSGMISLCERFLGMPVRRGVASSWLLPRICNEMHGQLN